MKKEQLLVEKIMQNVKADIEKINEAGHLYYKDKDGHVYTNSKETYRGVQDSVFISHGEWSDGEVIYDGESINPNDIEDYMYADYSEDCKMNGRKPTDAGYEEYIDQMGGADYVKSVMDDILFGRYE